MRTPFQGEDYRWYKDRPVQADDFNKMNSVAIFTGLVMSMFETVSSEELKSLIERGEKFVLLNALDRNSFEKGHIPGSINIPVERIESEAPGLMNKDELIIAYSRGPLCGASSVAADKLKTIGFRNVMRYRGGVEEWKEAGYPLHGHKAAPLEKGGKGKAEAATGTVKAAQDRIF